MSNFALLGICLIAGILLRLSNRLPKETPTVLNGFIFHISLPALVLAQVSQVVLTREAFYVASVAWVLFGLSLVFFLALSWLRTRSKTRSTRSIWDKRTLATLILTAGLGNTSFVGFPMLEALYGRESLKVAVLVDQMGSFLVFSLLGIGLASFYSSKSVSLGQIGRRIFAFPPIYALMMAFCLMPFHLPSFVLDLLTRLGSTLTPLALVSTGFQLKFDPRILRQNSFFLTLGLFFKLALGPAVLCVLYTKYFGWNGDSARIAILEAAMAPMITSAILVAEYELNTDLANLMVGIGIPLSFLTVPIWAHLLS